MDESLKNNPFLVTEGLPPYDRMQANDVVPAMGHVIVEATKKIEDIEQNLKPTWEGVMQPLEELDHAFSYAWSPVSHLLGVKNSDEFRKVHEEIQPTMVELGLRIAQSKPVYDCLKELQNGDGWDQLDEAQQRAIEANVRQAEHAGVGLEGKEKERFLEISRD